VLSLGFLAVVCTQYITEFKVSSNTLPIVPLYGVGMRLDSLSIYSTSETVPGSIEAHCESLFFAFPTMQCKMSSSSCDCDFPKQVDALAAIVYARTDSELCRGDNTLQQSIDGMRFVRAGMLVCLILVPLTTLVSVALGFSIRCKNTGKLAPIASTFIAVWSISSLVLGSWTLSRAMTALSTNILFCSWSVPTNGFGTLGYIGFCACLTTGCYAFVFIWMSYVSLQRLTAGGASETLLTTAKTVNV
jgi:hypothetical protein